MRATESLSDSTEFSSNFGFARARRTPDNTVVSGSNILRGVHLPSNASNEPWRETIRQKLIAECQVNPNLFQEIQNNLGFDLEEFITVLGDPRAFREAFLQPKYDYQAVQRELAQEMSVIRDLGVGQTEMQSAFKRMEARRQAARDLEVKFILTSCAASQNWLVRNTANLLRFTFGGLHAGLLVDGTLLEWGRGKCRQSLILPVLDPVGLLFAVDIQDKTYWQRFKQLMWDALNTVTIGLANYVYAHVRMFLLFRSNQK
jgi:hypothetical protein